MQNLKWNQDTKVSEILRQLRDQEMKSENGATKNNLYALSFAIGKAEALEFITER